MNETLNLAQSIPATYVVSLILLLLFISTLGNILSLLILEITCFFVEAVASLYSKLGSKISGKGIKKKSKKQGKK